MQWLGESNSLGKVNKKEVREGIDYLSGVWGRVVILWVQLSVGPP